MAWPMIGMARVKEKVGAGWHLAGLGARPRKNAVAQCLLAVRPSAVGSFFLPV
jgi:hypothetical protein